MKNCLPFGLVVVAIILIFSIRLTAAKSVAAQSKSSEIEEENVYDDDDYSYDDDDHILTSIKNDNPSNNSISKTEEPVVDATTKQLDNGIDLKLDGPLANPVTYACPEVCECSKDTLMVDCSNRNLTQIPKDIPKNVNKLNLRDNYLTKIEAHAFNGLIEVQEILLTRNQIESIDNEGFSEELAKLEHIGLSSNHLTNLDPNTFTQLSGLKKLCLNFNNITILEHTSLLNHSQLEELNLVGSNIEQLYETTFQNLPRLQRLQLANNPLDEEIDTNIFEPIKELKQLSMPKLDQDIIFNLCELLTSIDVINFETFNVSCFELVSGQTFEESVFTVKPLDVQKSHSPIVVAEEEGFLSDGVKISSTTEASVITTSIPIKIDQNTVEKVSNVNKETDVDGIDEEIKSTTLNTTIEGDPKSMMSSISNETINNMLLGIIIIAVCGLIVGVICRRDCFGIKTKMCRTRRPLPTDQIRPSEEVPLNKIQNN